MFLFLGRIKREELTIRKMIELYCRDKHNSKNGLCEKCKNITDYADRKLSKCMFGENKPICVDCPVHCYRSNEREYIREIMRYAGPRMILSHPMMAIMHKIDQKLSQRNFERKINK